MSNKYDDLLCEIFSRMEKEKIPCRESYLKGYMQAIKDDSKALQVRIALLEEDG